MLTSCIVLVAGSIAITFSPLPSKSNVKTFLISYLHLNQLSSRQFWSLRLKETVLLSEYLFETSDPNEYYYAHAHRMLSI